VTCWRWLAGAMCHLLVLQPVLGQPAGRQSGLRIVIVEGAGARNVVLQITPRPLIIRIEDANNGPVDGAMVTFTAPETGASGEFSNDSRVLQLTTGPDGLAVTGAYHPNATKGAYQIQVRAEFQGQVATASIPQMNVAQKKGRGKLIAIVAIAGAAATAAIVHNRKNKSTPAGPTITFGGGAVGAPK
jgi:hypothetical protein